MPRILLVDDEDLLRTVLRRLLERSGFEIATAASADEALTFLRRSPVQLVMSDLNMPGKDGLELMAEVRKRWPQTARVILTAEYSAPLLAALASGDVEQCVSKPWENSALVSLLSGLVVGAHAAG